MQFELAYDLEIEVDREVVFVLSGDRHRKVRLLITETGGEPGSVSFTGHSLGSSVKEIKAAKRDETPVVVKGRLEASGAARTVTLEPV